MESENELDPRRRRFAKSTIFILLSVMFKRYSSAAILCKYMHFKYRKTTKNYSRIPFITEFFFLATVARASLLGAPSLTFVWGGGGQDCYQEF